MDPIQQIAANSNFGGNLNPPDPRDHTLDLAAAGPIPDVYIPDISNQNIFMQGTMPTCGGHSGCWLRQYTHSVKTSQTEVLSPRFLWDFIKQIDGNALEAGTDMRSIFKTLQGRGDCSLSLLANDVSLTLEAYSDITLVPQTAIDDAKPRVIGNYAFVPTINFDSLKQAIYLNKAVILLVDCGSEWWTDTNGSSTWAESSILPIRPVHNRVSGHFVVAYGYDQSNIYFANSWSNGWGRNGIGYFGQNYVPNVRQAGFAYEPSSPVPVIVPSFHYAFNTNLKYQDPKNSPTEVNQLQKALQFLKLMTPGLFGPYGPATKTAVAAFQQQHGIVDTDGPGVNFGPQTRMALNKALNG